MSRGGFNGRGRGGDRGGFGDKSSRGGFDRGMRGGFSDDRLDIYLEEIDCHCSFTLFC